MDISMLDRVAFMRGRQTNFAICCMRISREYWVEVSVEELCFTKLAEALMISRYNKLGIECYPLASERANL